MTLSARIAVGPSLRLGLATAALAIGGVGATVATIAARSPDARLPASAAGVLATLLVASTAFRSHRRAGTTVLGVSDRPEVDVVSARADLDGAHRLAPSTMCWPGASATGFSVVALEPVDGGRARRRVVRIPIAHADLAAGDARALTRFLSWSLRRAPGVVPGAGAGAPANGADRTA